jgi:transcriptional regulator with XRE-family HTH domain
VTIFTGEESQSLPVTGIDVGMFGQRLRHIRRARGLTLAELGERVGRAPSALSLLENGRREPKLSLIEALASALSVSADDLMNKQPPSRRAQLEIALSQAQRDPAVADLGLPPLRVGAKVPSDVLEHVLALHA